MRKIAIICCCLLVSLTALTQSRVVYFKSADSLFKTHTLTKQDVKQDILFWNRVMEESHVQLYHAISKDDMQHLQDSLLNTLPDTISHEQALHIMGMLAGALNEGHIFCQRVLWLIVFMQIMLLDFLLLFKI